MSNSITKPFNVRTCGAAGDGHTDDTRAVQAALDGVAASGGGTVLVPPGVFSCNTLHLRSRVILHLAKGAVLRSREDPSCYPVIAETANLPGQIQAFLWGQGCIGSAIEGPGAIDGGHPEALAGEAARAVRFRPALLFLCECMDLRLSECELRNSAFWTAHLQRCRDVLIKGIRIRSHPERTNADGIDPDGCQRVRIVGCDVATGDDALVLKSTEGDACEDIVVEDCVFRSSCAAVKLGTESLGPIRRVVVRRCRLESSDRGIALHLKDGGEFEDVIFEDSTVLADGQFAVLIDASPRHSEHAFPGTIRRVSLRRLQVRTPGRCLVEGQTDGLIEDILMEDITWHATGPLLPNSEKPAGAARTSLRVAAPTPDARLVIQGVRGLTISGFRVRGDTSAKDCHIRECQ